MISAYEHRARTGPWLPPPQKKYNRRHDKRNNFMNWCMVIMLMHIVPLWLQAADLSFRGKAEGSFYGQEELCHPINNLKKNIPSNAIRDLKCSVGKKEQKVRNFKRTTNKNFIIPLNSILF